MKSNSHSNKRRSFIKTSAAAGATFLIVPRYVLGKGYTAPSDKLNIAAVGCGGKGDVNVRLSYNSGSDNIVALCDVDDRMAVKFRGQFPSAPYYKDYREMLSKSGNDIDAVLVSTPDHMHYPIAMAAMDLGKHVYCEKPLTHDIWEARQMAAKAKEKKVVSQMGNQGSSGKDTRITETMVQSGMIGEVYNVEVWTNRPVWPQGVQSPKDKGMTEPIPSEVDWNLWLGTAPNRDYHSAYMPFRWRGYWDFGTGALGDMGCHFIDVPYRALGLGYPTSVSCSVGQVYADFFKEAFFDDVCPPSSAIHLKFNNPKPILHKEISLSWYDGGIRPKLPEGCDYEQVFGDTDGGILFQGTKGILAAQLFGSNPTLYPKKKFAQVVLPKPKRALVENDTEGHQQQWVKACKKGYGTYTSSSFDQSGPLTEIVLMGNLAVRSFLHRTTNSKGNIQFEGRKKLIWDGANMKITNFEPANAFVKREYRGY